MCGRFTVLTQSEILDAVSAVQERLSLRTRLISPMLDESVTRKSVYPGSTIQAIGLANSMGKSGDASESTIGVSPYTWGFEAEQAGGHLVYNARIESVLSGSALWRDALEHGRCVVPAATFFEPHATEMTRAARTGNLVKRPYEFGEPNGQPLLLAGLNLQGRCAVVTTSPNRWVLPVHKRMPLALSFEEVETWLLGDCSALADRSEHELLVRPAAELAQPEAEQLSLLDL